MEDEKKQWTVRGVSVQMIRRVNVLSSHYSITNGEVLDRLVSLAHDQIYTAKTYSISEAFLDLDVTTGKTKLEETDATS